MLAASQSSINFVYVVSRLGDEEVGNGDRRTGRRSVPPSNSRGVPLQRRDEDVEIAGRIDVEEGLLPGHWALWQRGGRIRVVGRVWGWLGRKILGRGTHDAGKDLVPDPVGPGADDTVSRQPLLLRGVDDETVDARRAASP